MYMFVYTGRVHGTYTAVYTVRHGPYAAVYTTSTQPYTWAMYMARTRLCKCSRTRPVVYMAGRPTGPCTRSQTARYGRVRPVTAVYTARSQPVHGSVYGRV